MDTEAFQILAKYVGEESTRLHVQCVFFTVYRKLHLHLYSSPPLVAFIKASTTTAFAERFSRSDIDSFTFSSSATVASAKPSRSDWFASFASPGSTTS